MGDVAEKVWQAAQARESFAEVIDGAITGVPQVVQRRDGQEAVVVSRDYYERTRPSLKAYLLTHGGAGPEEDAFDRVMRDIREGRPAELHGAMRGSVRTPPGTDLAEPTGEVWEAEVRT